MADESATKEGSGINVGGCVGREETGRLDEVLKSHSAGFQANWIDAHANHAAPYYVD